MAEVLTQNAEHQLQPSKIEPDANRPSSPVRSLSFKYYIHDSVATLRFQLIGDLRAAHLTELAGSWETARTTLGLRQFVVDISQLYSSDKESRAWLLRMRGEGAAFQPADYFETSSSARPSPEQISAVKLSLLGRVLGMFSSGRKTA